MGLKVPVELLTDRIKKLIIQARNNYSEIEVASTTSITPGYRFWKKIEHFDIIMETIERCLTVSKVLLTIGLIVPALITAVIMFFYF